MRFFKKSQTNAANKIINCTKTTSINVSYTTVVKGAHLIKDGIKQDKMVTKSGRLDDLQNDKRYDAELRHRNPKD